MIRAVQLAVACVMVLMATADQLQADLVTNGNFETGTFAGWSVGSTQATPFTAALNDETILRL